MPEWPPGGGARCSRAVARRGGSGSPFRCRRSTGAPDAIGAPPAGPPARARVRHSTMPDPGPAPPVRARGPDLDGQSDGPAADGTDRSQVSVIGGGPQSFAPAPSGNLASGDPAVATGVGPDHQDPARSVLRQLRCASSAAALLARNHSRRAVSRAAGWPRAASPACLAHPRLSAAHLAGAAAQLPVHPVLLAIRTRGHHQIRCRQGHLVGGSAPCPLPSISSRRLRSRPLMS